MTQNLHQRSSTYTKYLALQYRARARGTNGYVDCWGLTRMARHELYQRPLLPSFAEASHANRAAFQSAYEQQTQDMVEVSKQEGAVIAVLRRGICVHVALMVGGNQVLEIKKDGQRARLTPWRVFRDQYPAPMWSIAFYD